MATYGSVGRMLTGHTREVETSRDQYQQEVVTILRLQIQGRKQCFQSLVRAGLVEDRLPGGTGIMGRHARNVVQ